MHFFEVGKISDRRCQGEDRILQCELDGGAATSNIEKNRYNLLDLAFSQSWRDVNVSAYSSVPNRLVGRNKRAGGKVLRKQ